MILKNIKKYFLNIKKNELKSIFKIISKTI